jgi:PAB-dependent poly(A)-specific ribonuclease subunit 2
MKRAGQYLCAATKNGGIHILDSNSLSVIKVFEGHTGSINDMDAKGDFLATCGWSPRQQFAYMLDPFTNVFSLKTLKQLPPIPFQTGAAFVQMHPRMSTTAFIASQNGQMQVIDLMNPDSANLRQSMYCPREPTWTTSQICSSIFPDWYNVSMTCSRERLLTV